MLGLITGSGFYDLPGLEDAVDRQVETPYGVVSLVYATWNGCPVVFLPRHGADHSVPPQRIPYRANLWALHQAGARAVFATAVSGGINPGYRNGELVLIDQFINLTRGSIWSTVARMCVPTGPGSRPRPRSRCTQASVATLSA